MNNVQRRKKRAKASKSNLTIVASQSVPAAEANQPQTAVSVARFNDLGTRIQAGKAVVLEVSADVLARTCTVLQSLGQHAMRLLAQVKVRRVNKRLQVQESVSLGEKRFVAIVQVDGQQFLLGGAPNSVSLLAQLNGDQAEHHEAPAFAEALKRQCEPNRNFA
jgi:hypothetical protein